MNNYRRYKVKFSAFSLIFSLYFTQTLTTLQLCNTKMDLQGVIQLANTLKQNKVTSFSYVFVPSSIHYLIDHHYTWYRNQSNRWSRSILCCRCFTKKSSSYSFHLLFLIIRLLFYTDTHKTVPPTQSNWPTRSRISCQQFATKPSNIHSFYLLIFLLFI
jgi:hypothetical protein